MSYIDFKKIKESISLPHFLTEVLGWSYDSLESSQRSMKFRSPEGMRVIIVSQKISNNYETYYYVNGRDYIEHRDKEGRVINDVNIGGGKSIFDMMYDELKLRKGIECNINQIGQILQKYIDAGKTVVPGEAKFKLEPVFYTQEEVKRTVANCKPLEDTSFLESRGIDLNILKEKIWLNVFKQIDSYNPDKQKLDGRPRIHKFTTVELRDLHGQVGGLSRKRNWTDIEMQSKNIEKRTHSKIFGSRADFIAMTNYIDKSKPLEKLHIFESIIDAASYYQLNYYNTPQKDANVLLVSSEGTLTKAQIDTIQELINKSNVKQVELNFDNDNKGLEYALDVCGNVHIEGKKDNVVSVSYSERGDKANAEVHINIILSDTKENADNQIKKIFPEEMFLNWLEADNFSIAHTHSTLENTLQHYTVTFSRRQELTKQIVDNLSDYKFDKKIELKLPIYKDFNDDLKLMGSMTPEQRIEVGKKIQNEKLSIDIELGEGKEKLSQSNNNNKQITM